MDNFLSVNSFKNNPLFSTTEFIETLYKTDLWHSNFYFSSHEVIHLNNMYKIQSLRRWWNNTWSRLFLSPYWISITFNSRSDRLFLQCLFTSPFRSYLGYHDLILNVYRYIWVKIYICLYMSLVMSIHTYGYNHL